MADSTLACMSWSRVDGSGALPAHVVKRGGRWLALTCAEAGERVASAAQALLALGRQKGEGGGNCKGGGWGARRLVVGFEGMDCPQGGA